MAVAAATPILSDKEAFKAYMTMARYIPLGRRLYLVNEVPFSGEESFGEGTFRFYKGYFHGPGNQPSIELIDGHCEKHKYGVLHCIDGPAIYNLDGNYAEWWVNGKVCKVRLTTTEGTIYEHTY